ncbi:MAG: Asp-tRNA(Asn)/Glu-tRNA(Gln) amidotransferase GatCAB subunit B, partial [Anaerolineaceae bacterium]
RADYFEALVTALALPARATKLAANWLLGEVARWLNAHDGDIAHFPIAASGLAALVLMSEGGKITATVAKDVFEQMAASGRSAAEIVEAGGLAQISGADELTAMVKNAVAANPKPVEDYRAGKETALKFLIGQVMRETKGRANPQAVQELLEQELS